MPSDPLVHRWGIDFTAYEQSLLLRSAVERQFEIVGEALGLADRGAPGLRPTVPELGETVGLRNRLIHGDDAVDDEIVWDVVRRKLPALEARLAALLGEEADVQ